MKGDGKPHGLPIRIQNLSIPATEQADTDQLVTTLATSIGNILTAKSLRSAITTLLFKPQQDNKNLLVAGVDAVLNQGEMLLLIGPPSSNTSILLRALSCTKDLPLSETSILDFGLLPPSSFTRSSPFSIKKSASEPGSLRSELVFMNQHDLHFATLSLQDSLLPVARAKTPSHSNTPNSPLSPSPSPSTTLSPSVQFSQTVNSLGLSHAHQTPIGSPLIRGLSGGERKRASLAESLLTRASVLLLDQPTSGLDSSTAQSILEYLKKWTIEGKRTVVVTAPQVSDPLLRVFDKVLVLDDAGRMVYFGPTGLGVVDEGGKKEEKGVENYFEKLGMGFKRRKDKGEGVVEFVVGCIEGRGNDLALERAWQESSVRKNLLESMATYEARYPFALCAGPLVSAVRAEKSTWLRRDSSHFTVSYVRQVAILVSRQFALIWSELPSYKTKTCVNLLLSVLVGTLFYNLPKTTEAAFTRGSLLFLSVMFNCYLSLAELGKAIEGREIVRRQADWGFFQSSAVALARVAGDLPLIFFQVLLFGSITYFLTGLQRSLDHFATYILFVYCTALNMSAMFRMFATFSPNFDVAIRYCGVALNVLVVFAGYFIPTPSMVPWLRWIHFIVDPISYSYEAVLSNEFRGLDLTCSPADIIPSGPSYTSPSHQTCRLPGSTSGSLIVSGSSYLSSAYSFHHRPWRNLGIILAQAVVFLVIGIVATELFHFAPEGRKRIWARTERVKKRLRGQWYKSGTGGEQGEDAEALLGEGAVGSRFGEHENNTFDETEELNEVLRVEGKTLSWKDVSLWVDTPTDTRRLLDRVSGFIKPGETCALMGKTGAGKSTLLNVLSGRMDGVVKGSILVDGQPLRSEFFRTTGYVEQFDLHDEQATVREALEFSALLRQDANIPRKEKLAYVDVVLDLLDLTHIQDAIIGTPSAGLSLEQRKKVTLAVETVAKPAILFCDEPTTGLDTKSALRVVKLLKRLAKTGLAVIATIHQPTAETFSEFDNLLLLQRGGKQVYFGKREDAFSFFPEDKKSSFPNPADFLLDAAGAGTEDVTDEQLAQDAGEVAGLDRLSRLWITSAQAKALRTTLEELGSRTYSAKGTSNAKSNAASIFRQSIELTKRVSRNYFRDHSYSYTKFFTSTVVSTIIGLSFFQLGHSIVSLQNRLFSVFLILFVPPVFMNLSIFKMVKLRSLWHARERPAKVYGSTAFVSSLLVSEVPYSVACGTIFWSIWYFLVGFDIDPSKMAFSFTMVQLFFFFQSTWAMWITALAPSLGAIANLLPFFLVSMECFNGSLMPYRFMPPYWKWLYWMSPFQWYVRAMLGTLVPGVEVECAATEVVKFATVWGETCASYLTAYLSTHPGHLLNPTSNTTCSFCPLSSGGDYLSTLNIPSPALSRFSKLEDRHIALLIFSSYTITNIILIYLFTFYPPFTILRLDNLPIFGIAGRKRNSEKVAAEEWAKELVEAREGGRVLGGEAVEGTVDAFA
ncbi:catalytic activity: RhaA is able to hydrolyze alpha-1 [Meredithblackwellia eburnea MCA 4105]